MNNKKNSDSKKHIVMIFVMPLGVDENLFILNVSNEKATTSDVKDSVQSRHKVSGRMVSMKVNAEKSYFFLEDGCFKKKYNGTGKKEKWSIELSSNEFKILRFLYWSRKRRQVLDSFKDEMSEAEIINIIDRHIKLGSLVQSKDLLLCVFNDPEYWK